MGLKITVKTAHEAFLFNDQIKDQGLQRGEDYTWRFNPAVNTWLRDEVVTQATVEFDFKDRQWETYFKLRWIET